MNKQTFNPLKITLSDIKKYETTPPTSPCNSDKRKLCVLCLKQSKKYLTVFTSHKNNTPIYLAFTQELSSILQTQFPSTFKAMSVTNFINQKKNEISPLILTEILNPESLSVLLGLNTTNTYYPPHNFPFVELSNPNFITLHSPFIKFIPSLKAFEGFTINNTTKLILFPKSHQTKAPFSSSKPKYYPLSFIKKVCPSLKFTPVSFQKHSPS